MQFTTTYLKEHSNLPGPRANLELLYSFIANAQEEEIAACLEHPYESNNSPEEFVLMCGLAAAIYNNASTGNAIPLNLTQYANHESWRVREGICFGFQKSKNFMEPAEMLSALMPLLSGTALEQRTYIATLCEPSLLKNYIQANHVLESLLDVTLTNFNQNEKLSDDLKVLRKALAYCWSVALCGDEADPSTFKQLLNYRSSKHIQWILRENLKKNRLQKLGQDWLAAFSDIL